MRSIKKYILLLLFIAPLLFSYPYSEAARGIGVLPTSPSAEKVTGDQWLFVIGIDTYLHWPALTTAVSDAKSLRDVLLSRYHFDKDHLIEIYDDQATRKNIIEKLRHLAKKVKLDDSLLIFYAGHGHLDSITKEGSWIPVESGLKDASAWISNHDIKNYLRVDAIKARHILLISDSCFSGDYFRGYRGKLPEVTDELIKRAYTLTSRQAITSGGLEPVSDTGFGNNSVFSHFLIKTLNENLRPFLVPSDFFPKIKAGVAENAEQFPRFGSLTGTGGQQGGELVLFLKRGVSLEDKKRELAYLKKLEAAAEEASKREAQEIEKRERALAELDGEIVRLKKKLGDTGAKPDDSLDAMLALVRKREEQHKRLEELKKQRQEEEARRRAEIARLKEERRKRLIASLEEDIRKYKEIVSSPYGKDLKDAAWKSLASRYAESSEGLKTGDTEKLLINLKWPNAEPAFNNSISMKFVMIPPGTFTMGSPSGAPGRDSDERQHRVSLTNAFYMQTTEVTQGQWHAIMGTNPSSFKNCGDSCPIEKVSWNECQEFLRRLNEKEGTSKYRLPTEAEWEYACRAGSTTAFANGGITELQCGNDPNLNAMGWYCGNSAKKTHPVAQKTPNAWGLYDMHGNVYEWCQDWYGDYPTSYVTDPRGLRSGQFRVLRGGCWDYSAMYCRSALRYRCGPDDRGYCFGFRLARDP
jgi:formylglycine-generating enzyme required for sulfatase activity